MNPRWRRDRWKRRGNAFADAAASGTGKGCGLVLGIFFGLVIAGALARLFGWELPPL